jgi:hypothetical protein
LRADGGYFAGALARAALASEVEFAIGAHRIAPLWRTLAGIAETDWVDAIDMPGAQVAVADYTPGWWPTDTRLLIRRVRLDPTTQLSTDPRARRWRTLHPEQRVLPLVELAGAHAVYGYRFVLTNLDVSTPDNATAVEHCYRHRTMIENIFRDSKHGAALRHLPSGYPQVNRAWMWAALLAASIAGWLHQLTAVRGPTGLIGHGVRGGQAMIQNNAVAYHGPNNVVPPSPSPSVGGPTRSNSFLVARPISTPSSCRNACGARELGHRL